MAEETEREETLSDEDIVTTPKVSRRVLLTGAGAALGAATLSGTAFADEAETDSDGGDAGDMGDAKEGDEGDAGDTEGDSDSGDASEGDTDDGDTAEEGDTKMQGDGDN